MTRENLQEQINNCKVTYGVKYYSTILIYWFIDRIHFFLPDVKLSAYSNKRNSSLTLLRRARFLETHSTSSNEDVHVQTLSVQQRMHTIESWIQSTTLSSLDQSIASHDSHSHNIEVLNPIQQNLSLCTDIPPSEPPSDYDPSFICSV